MKYVIAIAQTKNFSKAAELLYVSQPALSQYINRLEKELGVLLFERTKSKVSLSEAGELFLKDAVSILEASENLKSKMLELSSSKSSRLKVGVSQFYGKYFLPTVIPIFNKSQPHTIMEITEDESSILEEKIITNQIDLAIIPLPLSSDKVKYDLIYEEKIKFAICSSNHKFENFLNVSADDYIDLSIFQDEPFIALNNGYKMRTILESICKEFNFQPKVILETKNLDTVNSLVSQNYGVSLLPTLISKYSNVKYFAVNSSHSSRSIVAAYNRNKHVSQEMLGFISVLRDVLYKIDTD